MIRKIKKKRKKPFMPLNFKMSIVILIAASVALLVYLGSTWFENKISDVHYRSKEAVEKNIGNAYLSLEETIKSEHLKGSDADEIQKWVYNHPYTYLYVYDNKKSSFDGGWRSDSKKSDNIHVITPGQQREKLKKFGVDKDEEDENKERISPSLFKTDTQNRIVNFADGPYYVYIDVYREEHWHEIMWLIKVILCTLCFIIIILTYNSRVLKRIKTLSDDVYLISDGNLKAPIAPTANDELGILAESVDNMRYSILERLQNEKKAWDANTQLITAMSHDIRTPLTSLIGYLDIIEGGKYSSVEDLNKYISSCRDKAFQLKDLSDKLFQYFLVFGSSDKDKKLETFDGAILLQQLISEHTAELMSYGYKIEFDYKIEAESPIVADISGIRRLFDNIFSNIMKYGDKKYHITVSVNSEKEKIVIWILNRILASSKKVESNKIGLKTCEKICSDMGGTFDYGENDGIFSTKIIIPIVEKEENCEEEENKDDENPTLPTTLGTTL